MFDLLTWISKALVLCRGNTSSTLQVLQQSPPSYTGNGDAAQLLPLNRWRNSLLWVGLLLYGERLRLSCIRRPRRQSLIFLFGLPRPKKTRQSGARCWSWSRLIGETSSMQMTAHRTCKVRCALRPNRSSANLGQESALSWVGRPCAKKAGVRPLDQKEGAVWFLSCR